MDVETNLLFEDTCNTCQYLEQKNRYPSLLYDDVEQTNLFMTLLFSYYLNPIKQRLYGSQLLRRTCLSSGLSCGGSTLNDGLWTPLDSV